MTASAGLLLVDEIVPRIQAAVPRCVKTVGCEDVDELIQDTVTSAAQMLETCEVSGKPIFPASIAYYAIQRGKSGRRSYGATRTDVLCASAQLDGSVTLSSMDEGIATDGEGDGLTLHDVLAKHEEDPAQQAARQIDWSELMADLDDRKLAILRATAEGSKLEELAKRFGISKPRISQLKTELGRQVKARWGDDALADAMCTPVWYACLNATKEQARCRHERAALAEGR